MKTNPTALPVPAGAPPAAQGGPGGSFAPKPPSKGGLSIKVVASIQGIYAREEQKRERVEGMQKGMPLQPGWGGQGR